MENVTGTTGDERLRYSMKIYVGCPKCYQLTKDGVFCEHCGAPLHENTDAVIRLEKLGLQKDNEIIIIGLLEKILEKLDKILQQNKSIE